MTDRLPLASLKPAPWNPRLIRDARFQQLCRSLEADPAFMDERPILATADGTIYAGNMRWRAAQHLGWETVPARIADIPEQLAKERALRDNNQFGEWQEQELAELLAGLQTAGSDLDLLGFDEGRLSALLDSVGLNGDVPVPEASEQVEPSLKAECFVEMYCSREALEQFEPTLQEWSGQDGVTVNIQAG